MSNWIIEQYASLKNMQMKVQNCVKEQLTIAWQIKRQIVKILYLKTKNEMKLTIFVSSSVTHPPKQ